jgi:hypothetical protein
VVTNITHADKENRGSTFNQSEADINSMKPRKLAFYELEAADNDSESEILRGINLLLESAGKFSCYAHTSEESKGAFGICSPRVAILDVMEVSSQYAAGIASKCAIS